MNVRFPMLGIALMTAVFVTPPVFAEPRPRDAAEGSRDPSSGESLLLASPPSLIHYQGVLRDASDAPRNGLFDMIFRFFSASIGGDEILVDRHLAAGTGAVFVTGGLFGADLGGGAVSDGAGPDPVSGPYTSVSQVFRDYSSVFLELEIAGETLAPRIKVLSSAYSQNSNSLDGLDSTQLARLGALNTFLSRQIIQISQNNLLYLNGNFNDYWTATHNGADVAYLTEDGDLVLSTGNLNVNGGHFTGDGAGLTNVNADSVGGKAAATLLDTSATAQAKSGDLTVSDLTLSGGDLGVPVGFNLNVLAQVTLSTKANGNIFSGIDEDNNDTNRQAVWYHNGSAVQANKLMDLDESGALRIRGMLAQNSLFDLAETFFMAEPVEPGDLVSVDSSRPDAIRRTSMEADATVLGVVSTRPGVLLGGAPFDTGALAEAWGGEVLKRFESERPGIEAEILAGDLMLARSEDRAGQLEDLALQRFHARHFAPIALAGRVPVKVDAAFGAIAPGDALAPSPVPGVAMKATKPGPVVGVALEPLRFGSGMVLALVNRGWFSGPVTDPSTSSADAGPAVTIARRLAASGLPQPQERIVQDVSSEREPAGTAVESVPFAFPLAIREEVESGDVLAADEDRPGEFALARRMADPAVVGIAAGSPQMIWRGRAPLAMPGTVVRCKVDASHGAIRPGQMLVASSTPGFAMASEEAKPGTVIAKALESLESGTGMILVLVQPR